MNCLAVCLVRVRAGIVPHERLGNEVVGVLEFQLLGATTRPIQSDDQFHCSSRELTGLQERIQVAVELRGMHPFLRAPARGSGYASSRRPVCVKDLYASTVRS